MRDLEPAGGENGFALVLVKSCHDWVLFRMKTPNVQRSTSNVQLGRAELSVQRWALSDLSELSVCLVIPLPADSLVMAEAALPHEARPGPR